MPVDYSQAVAWLRKAAAQGVPGGQYPLAQMYEYGQGVERDLAAALKWYHRSRAGGHQRASERLRHLSARCGDTDSEAAVLSATGAASSPPP